MTPAIKNICFTINNPGEDDKVLFDPTIMLYLVYQLEVSESGTPHFQGYMELTKAKCLNSIKTMLDCQHAHIETRHKNSTAKQASDYCKKTE